MATKAAAASPRRVDALRCAPAGWDFLWAEYLASRAESEAYGRETVRAAEARIAREIRRLPPFDRTAPRAMDAERRRLLRQTAADYGEIQRKLEALVEETANLHATLIRTPAPDAPALLWKIEQLLGAGAACHEAREAVIGDARRLLEPSPSAGFTARSAWTTLVAAAFLKLSPGGRSRSRAPRRSSRD